MESSYYTLIIFFLFLIVIFLLPFRGGVELFTLGQWKNKINTPKLEQGYCGPDFSKFGPNDNVAVRCVGDGKMTPDDCCRLRDIGQVCAVNLDNWEAYECKYSPGPACSRCKTQNAQY